MLMLVGVSLMAYPFISNFLYERQQQQVIYRYEEKTETLSDDQVAAAFAEAERYNQSLRQSHFTIADPFEAEATQESTEVYQYLRELLGSDVMGFIEIPAISVYLPVSYGTSDEVLQNGVGHMENTSLPVGGPGTHAVLSAHSGLTDKKLFTDLSLLVEGDVFYIHVWGRTLAYRVDQILTVLPQDMEALHIVPDQEYVTLLTCTPYGVNSHRLLVRGTAIPYTPEEAQSSAEQPERAPSEWMRQYAMALQVGLVLLAVLVLLIAFLGGRRRRNG